MFIQSVAKLVIFGYHGMFPFFKKKISLLPCPVVTIGRLEIIKRVNDVYVICTHKCVTGYGF